MDRVEYLAGQVNALEGAIAALIETHPTLPRLKQALTACLEAQKRARQGLALTPEFLAGQQAEHEALLAAIAEEESKRP